MSYHTISPLRRRALRARAAFARLGVSASLLTVLALAACAGADKGPTEPVTPPVVPPIGTDPGTPTTGIASVASTGLPSGVSSRVTLKNGSVERLLVGTSSVAGLTAGDWIATAEAVTADGITYLPTPVTQTVTVAAAGTVSINVSYIANTGALDVTISGLPAGGNADVVITGPNNFRRSFGLSLSITALAPGAYHVDARGVKLSAGSFAPVTAQQDINVASGNTPTTLAIPYVLAPSIISVAIAGVPGGSAAAVTLTPPTGSNIAVTASTRLAAALAGRWQMNAVPIKSSGFTFSPTPSSKDTSVASGDSLTFNVQYTVSTGAIAFAVGGLGNGVNGAVTVTGPAGYQKSITATTTVTDLAPGVYTIKADSVISGGVTYRTAVPTQQVTVTASLIAAPGIVTYSNAVAILTVGISGIPVGATNMVEVSGPAGFDRFISGTTTFSNVTPGVYTIVSSPVLLPGGIRYEGTPATVTRTLAFGITDSVGVIYARAGGKASVTVMGLPAGVSSAMTLTGNGLTTPITGTVTIDNLAPGSYTLSASPVTVSTTVYSPSPVSSTVAITTGNTTNATITYTAGVVTPPTPPGGGGGINLIMDGFYLTQATQKMDGSVPLVAGRDALLRVFVHASETNTVQPTVRVRIYDGTTLLQTLTLSAPEGSVRTALAEGTLSSTWNSLIPAANVRTAMKIVADVDPSSLIAEGDETDNSWPRNGTPQSMTVNVVPAFNVRFVPVTVGALTGNVTVANKDQFLVSTRRMHPINDVNSDVRAPFTSSAATLQSGDANGAWLTVLNEMNALRTADGAPSTTHYYGVVKVSYNSGVAGYGYVPGRAAMGWDYLPSGDAVAVHEWGHNFGRPHTNCGGADSPDLTFPYAGGTIGQWGWNPGTGGLIAPTATDVMGYCSNQWTSDWTWTKVMSQRASAGTTAAASVTGAKQEGLLVWGRIVNGKVVLEPSFRVNSRPTPANLRGTQRVQALDARGNTLFELPMEAEKVDHVLDRDERHFAVVLPWSAKLERSLATLRVSDVRQPFSVGAVSSAATLRAATSAGNANVSNGVDSIPVVMPATGATISAVSASRSRIEWNKSQYPMAIVRDAASGEIMAFVRNPGDVVVTNGRKVEMVFSDGVRSTIEKK
ncbi:MAG: M66 family metalloprotease [Gemmatimonas sp.]